MTIYAFAEVSSLRRSEADHLTEVYVRCQAVRLQERNVIRLDEAYQHVFGTEGGCRWCRRELERVRQA